MKQNTSTPKITFKKQKVIEYKSKQKFPKNNKYVLKKSTSSNEDYASAIVLGLNDALVELTGTLAGLSLAIGNTKIIGATGLIMGLAASLSMAASEFLSVEEDSTLKSSKISALYTGTAYILTVMSLVIPYFLFTDVKMALISMLILSVCIIFGYTKYISKKKKLNFRKKFLTMSSISLGVAFISFIFGMIVKNLFGI